MFNQPESSVDENNLDKLCELFLISADKIVKRISEHLSSEKKEIM